MGVTHSRADEAQPSHGRLIPDPEVILERSSRAITVTHLEKVHAVGTVAHQDLELDLSGLLLLAPCRVDPEHVVP